MTHARCRRAQLRRVPHGGAAAAATPSTRCGRGQQDDNDEAVRIAPRRRRLPPHARAWTTPPTATTRARSQARRRRRANGGPPQRTMPNARPSAPSAAHAAGHRPLPQPGQRRAITRPAARRGLAPRLGDIRYNTVLNIAQPADAVSSWGIMVDADDPLTGEKVAARSTSGRTSPTWPRRASSTSSATSTARSRPPTSPTARTFRDWVSAGAARGGRRAARRCTSAEISKRLAGDARRSSARRLRRARREQARRRELRAALDAMKAAGARRAARATTSRRPAQAKAGGDAEPGPRHRRSRRQLINPAMLQLAGHARRHRRVKRPARRRVSPLALRQPGAVVRACADARERAGRARRLPHRGGARAFVADRPGRHPREEVPAATGETPAAQQDRVRRGCSTTSSAATTTRSSPTRWVTRSGFATTSSRSSGAAVLPARSTGSSARKNGQVTDPCTDAVDRRRRVRRARATGIR